MATIKKRRWQNGNGEWSEAWVLRYTDGQGVSRRKQFDKKGDASAYLTKAAFEVSQGIHTADSASVTIGEAADLFLDHKKAIDLERSSTKRYDEIIRLHIKPLLGADKLSRLTMPAVQNYVDALVLTRSKAMAGKALSTLRMIITHAQGRGLIAQNVTKGVKVVRSKREKKKIIIPAKADLKAMLEKSQADFPDFHPLLMTAIFTGLRSSELRGLRRSDVDLRGGSITVEQRADSWGVIGPPKSEAGTRTVPIPPMLVSVLRAWLLRAPHSHLGLLFPNSGGGARLHSNMLNREYWPLQVAAGIAEPSGKIVDGEPVMRARYAFHTLRHAAASAWIKQRIDIKRLQSWLGHASVQMTVDTYGHLLVDEAGDAAVAAAAQADFLA